MFNEQEKVKVDNNHDGVIIRQHPDRTSCLVKYNKQTGWVQNGRISKAETQRRQQPAGKADGSVNGINGTTGVLNNTTTNNPTTTTMSAVESSTTMGNPTPTV